MSNLHEVDNAVKILKKNNLSILHCNSAYPTPINDLNLNVINFFQIDINLLKLVFQITQSD